MSPQLPPTDEAFEKELQRLAPRPMSEEGRDNLRALFAQHQVQETTAATASMESPANDNLKPFPIWRYAAAAAAVVVLGLSLGIAGFGPQGSSQSGIPVLNAADAERKPNWNLYQRVGVRSEVVRQERVGDIMNSQQGPRARVKYHYVDHIEYVNPKNNERVIVTKPREEVKIENALHF